MLEVTCSNLTLDSVLETSVRPINQTKLSYRVMSQSLLILWSKMSKLDYATELTSLLRIILISFFKKKKS